MEPIVSFSFTTDVCVEYQWKDLIHVFSFCTHVVSSVTNGFGYSKGKIQTHLEQARDQISLQLFELGLELLQDT